MPSSITLTLSPAPGSGTFPFPPKHLRLSPDAAPIILGSAGQTGTQGEPAREAKPHNGWFGPLNASPAANEKGKVQTALVEEGVYPLSLSAIHAQIRVVGAKVYVRDMGAAFKTFVNGACVSKDVDMELRSGDLLTLGSKIPRNRNTPANITDDHLKQVTAVVTIA